MADLAGQAIIDLGVTRDRSFRAVDRIDIDRVAAAFAIQPAPPLLQVSDQFMPLQSSGRPDVDGERQDFDQVGISSRVRVRGRQGITFLQKTLS